jgi:hypothetical protein
MCHPSLQDGHLQLQPLEGGKNKTTWMDAKVNLASMVAGL